MIFQIRCCSTAALKDISRNPAFRGEYMSAWQVEKFGGIDKLALSNSVKVPEISKPTYLKVKVLASAVNPLDLYMTGGYGNNVLSCLKKLYGIIDCKEDDSAPLILGRDFCGEIVSKGPKVTRDLKIGDIVYGAVPPHEQGSYADQVVVDEDLMCKKPEKLSPLEAASVPYGAMTAWSALKITGDLMMTDPKSQRVLVLGGSGAVGGAAIQLLKSWGSTVITTCSTDAVPLVSSLGADIVIDYTQKESLREIELAGKYNIILDAAGNVNSTTYVAFLRDWSNSKFITLRSPFLKNTDNLGIVGGMVKNAADIVENNLTTGALGKGATVRWGFFAPLGVALNEINSLLKAEQMKPIIDSEFQYSDLPSAFKRVSDGHLRGKVVVSH